jgi:hypothetical protein
MGLTLRSLPSDVTPPMHLSQPQPESEPQILILINIDSWPRLTLARRQCAVRRLILYVAFFSSSVNRAIMDTQ